MKKIVKFGFTIAFSIILIVNFTSLAGGDGEKPEWEIGDQWKYDMTVLGFSGTVTHEVSDITSINVKGTDYDVYDMEVKGSGGVQHMYYLISDLAIVKTETPTMGTDPPLVNSYDPPKEDFNFPLTVEKTWNSSYTQFISGGGLEPVNITFVETYTAVTIESITVKAGTFECYRIESYDDREYANTTRWYSEEVRNVVKSEVNMSGIATEMELKSFSFKGEGDGSEEDPIFESFILIIIILIVVVLIVILLIIGKRKKAQKASAPPHLQESSQPKSAPPPKKHIPPPPQK